MTLKELGWTKELEIAFAPHREKGWVPARLIRETSINFSAFLKGGEEIHCILCGDALNRARSVTARKNQRTTTSD